MRPSEVAPSGAQGDLGVATAKSRTPQQLLEGVAASLKSQTPSLILLVYLFRVQKLAMKNHRENAVRHLHL